MAAGLADDTPALGRQETPMSRMVRMVLSGPAMSVLWLLICALYIQTQVGWQLLPQMLPHELAIAAMGVFGPLAFIWIVTTFQLRSRELSQASKLLAARVDQLVFPSPAGEARIHAIRDQ